MNVRAVPDGDIHRPALTALTLIAGHHGIATSPEALAHELALTGSEPMASMLVAAATSLGLKAKAITADVESVVKLRDVFPIIALTGKGSVVIIVGVRVEAENPHQVVILDPAAEMPRMIPISVEDFAADFGGTIVFIKRTYALSDPAQPFGLRWFIPEILRQKRIFRDIALAALALHVVGLTLPIFVQLVVDKVLVHRTMSTLLVLLVGTVAAILFEAGFGYLRQYLLLWASNKIDIRLTRRIFAHLLSLPITHFEMVSTGVTVQHMQQMEKIRQFLTGRMFLTALDATALFIFVPVLLFYSGTLTLIVVLFTALIAGIVFALMEPFKARLQRLYNAEAERQAMMVEAIGGMRTVKSLALEPVQRRKWDDRSAAAINMSFDVGRISIGAGSVTAMLEKLMTVSLISAGAFLVFRQDLSVGALIAFQMLSGRVVAPLVQIAAIIPEYQETALSVRMLGTIMNTPSERGRSGGVRPEFRGGIEFDDVTFRYAPDRPPALDHITLSIMPGNVVGIVGRSGSGKSTLAKLIQSLYPPQEGVIRLDGIDLREIDLPHLRQNVGIVLQESFLFRGTVRENISVTKRDASHDEIVAAARIAGADEFIEKLPQSYDTLLEENASNLSGGQKQRLAIARAILPRPRYLILDEATSSLDPDSESVFMDNLARIAQGRTVIIISHRLSTLVTCNAILVMGNGRIIDVGSHAQLLQRCQVYKHLWNQQNRHL